MSKPSAEAMAKAIQILGHTKAEEPSYMCDKTPPCNLCVRVALALDAERRAATQAHAEHLRLCVEAQAKADRERQEAEDRAERIARAVWEEAATHIRRIAHFNPTPETIVTEFDLRARAEGTL